MSKSVQFQRLFTHLLLAIVFGISLLFLVMAWQGIGSAKAMGPTQINNDITANTTWVVADSPYHLMGTIIVSGVLTIDPGVVISGTNGARLIINGQLVANGTVAQPITFTSNPGTCVWEGVQLNSGNNDIHYSQFSNARYAIKIETSSNDNQIHFSSFQNNGGCIPENDPLSGAIVGSSDNTIITSNVFTNNNTAIYLSRSGGNTITNNVISGTKKVGLALFPANITPSNDNQILSNTIRFGNGYGLYVALGNDNQIRGNQIYSNAGGGMQVEEQGASLGNRFIIQDNDVYNNGGNGLLITDTIGLDLFDNLIYDNDEGVTWGLNNGFGVGVGANITGNVICQNPTYLLNNQDGGGIVPAELNWWGTNAPAIGSDIQGAVDIDPQIIFAGVPNLAVLPADGSSSTSVVISLAGGGVTVPARARMISVSADIGNVSPSVLTLDNSGQAIATYTAGNISGPVTITGTDLCTATPISITLVLSSTELSIQKTATVATVIPGETVTYNIPYNNTSGITATNVRITDTLPTGIVWQSDNAASLGFTQLQTSPSVVWARSNLAGGASGTIVLTGSVLATAGCNQALINTATIASETAESVIVNNQDTATVNTTCADVTITKQGPGGTLSPGQTVTFTVSYTNIGVIPAENVVITDVSPIDGGVITLLNGVTLQPGASNTQIQVPFTLPPSFCTINPPSHLVNTAYISTSTPEVSMSNNQDTADGTKGAPAIDCGTDLTIAKTLTNLANSAGKVTTYTITYENTGLNTATGVVITDFLHPDVVYVADTASVTRTIVGDTVQWSLGNILPSLGPQSFELGVLIDPAALPSACVGGSFAITNAVTIGSSSFDADLGSNFSQVGPDLIACAPDLVVTKNDNVGSLDPRLIVQAGDYITYTINVVNVGATPATNVVLTETLPTNTIFVGPAGWMLGGGSTYTYNVGDLAPFSGDSVLFVVQVDPSLPCSETSVVNTVQTDSDQTDADPLDNISNEDTPVECQPLTLSKDDNIFCAVPGQLIEYNINIQNNQPTAATNLQLMEYVPANTSFQGPVNGTWIAAPPDMYQHPISTIAANGQENIPFWVRVDQSIPTSVTVITNAVNLTPPNATFVLTTAIEHNAPDLWVVKNDNIELLPRATLEKIARIEQKAGTVPWLEGFKTRPRAPQAIYAKPGDVISYTIGYGNAGSGSANDVVLTETLPANVTFLGPNYWVPVGSNTYVYTIPNLVAGQGGILDLRVRIDDPFPFNTPGITNTVEISSNFVQECDASDNISVEFTHVRETTFYYLPIINLPPRQEPNVQLEWLNQDHDRVREEDGSTGTAFNPDGRNDGAFQLTINTGEVGHTKTIDYVDMFTTQSNSTVWDTVVGNSLLVLGAFQGNTRLNSNNGTLNQNITTQAIYTTYLADDIGQTRFRCDLYNYTVTIYFTDGTQASDVADIDCPPPPPPPPPPQILSWVSDVAADDRTNQIFIASPREDAVHVIDGGPDTYNRAIGVGNGPTGLAVITTTTSSKVAVAHAYANNDWRPGVWYINTSNLAQHPMTYDNGYVGAAPVKVTANSQTNRFYVSNYYDLMPHIDSTNEIRLSWVEKKNFQASYGLEASTRSNLVYMAAIDTGELIIFDAAQSEANPYNSPSNPGYGACHNAPPDNDNNGDADPRIMRMVAVNSATGHVFVTSPPDPNPNLNQTSSLVYVLDEDTLLAEAQANGGRPSDTTCTWNFGQREQRSPTALPGKGWIQTFILPGAVSAGEEGITVNPVTGKVYITDGPGDQVFVLQDQVGSAMFTVINTIPVGDNPQGVDVNPNTNRIYVANARNQSAPYGTVSIIDGITDTVIKTVPLTNAP